MKIVVQQCHLMNGLILIFMTKMRMIVVAVVLKNTTLVDMITIVTELTLWFQLLCPMFVVIIR